MTTNVRNHYGSVENYCRELQKRIRHMKDLAPGVPPTVRADMERTARALEEVYWDLTDSDLYRK